MYEGTNYTSEDWDNLEIQLSDRHDINSFKSQMKSLFEAYGFGIKLIDSYEGDALYSGQVAYFTIEGRPYYTEAIHEILTEIFGDIVNE